MDDNLPGLLNDIFNKVQIKMSFRTSESDIIFNMKNSFN